MLHYRLNINVAENCHMVKIKIELKGIKRCNKYTNGTTDIKREIFKNMKKGKENICEVANQRCLVDTESVLEESIIVSLAKYHY